MSIVRHIHGLDNVSETHRGGVLTIGNFDGVHRGHRRIIAAARSLARADNLPVVAMTFNPHPDLVIRPDDRPWRLVHHDEKVRRLLLAGADYVVTVTPDSQLMGMEPDIFIDTVIMGRFTPRHLVEGHNFFFGRRRSGTIASLQQAGREKSFLVHVVDAVMMEIDGEKVRISSTLIRRLIHQGKVALVAEMLTMPYMLSGPVVGGEQYGRVLKFPTANVLPGEQVLPADGVYAGWARVHGKTCAAAISIGCKPTLGLTARTVEANLIDASGNYYGHVMDLAFVKRLRGQIKFASADALQKQIARDVQQTREIINVE